jgi:hypothetical protein
MASKADDSVKKVKKPRLLVIEAKTKKPVHAIKLTQTDEPHIAKATAGLLRNMDTNRYFVKEDL